MKQRINLKLQCFLHNAALFCCGALVLLLAVLAILELIPAPARSLRVESAFEVSSAAIYADGSLYSTEIRGTLKNTGKKTVQIDEMKVVISDGSFKKKVNIEGFGIPAGAEHEVVFHLEDAIDFDTVHEVTALREGEALSLQNRSVDAFPISGLAIFYLLLLVPAILLLVFAAKKRYYLYQEIRANG